MPTARSLLLLLLLLLSMTANSRAVAPPEQSARQTETSTIKVGFIYQFTHFIHWPSPDTTDPDQRFVIAVLGDPVMLDRLMALEGSGHRVGDRPIRVIPVPDANRLPDCALLFIGAAGSHRIDSILRQLSGRNVLTVADSPGLAERGVAINFYQRRGRLRFELNPVALRAAGLSAEAQLFDVARIVATQRHRPAAPGQWRRR